MYLLSLYYNTLNLRDLLSVLLLCFTVFGFEGSDLLLSDCVQLHIASRRIQPIYQAFSFTMTVFLGGF